MFDAGNLYVISAPSGTGKTTLVNKLITELEGITVSISHTTRPKRPAEIHGHHYYFIEADEFEKMIEQEHFLEFATIYDHFYGTSRLWVEETLAKGDDVILEIDWQGFQQIKRLFPRTTGIFILPPSVADLRVRLINRQQDRRDIIKKRLQDVKETVSHIHEYDYIVINDDLTHALQDLKAILIAGRLAQKRQAHKYTALLKELGEMPEFD